MSELKEISRRARALRAGGQPALVATLVAVQGSSYRRPGARLLIDCTGVAAGSVSGGCLERDLARRGWWHTAGGGPALVTYDSTDDDDGLGDRIGLGCNGVVDILIERLSPDSAGGSAFDFIERCLSAEARGVLVTVFRSTDPAVPAGTWVGLGAADASPAGNTDHPDLLTAAGRLRQTLERTAVVSLRKGACQALAEVIEPPPHLFLLGTGPEAPPLVAQAVALGWSTTVWDCRARFETRARFATADHVRMGPLAGLLAAVDRSARAAALVMAHDFDRDREALATLLGSKARYVGVLGPRRRTERLLAEIAGAPGAPIDVQADGLARLYAPAGLSIGAESPAEIALSIASEIETVLTGESIGHLRNRPGAIHRRPAISAAPPLAAAGDR